MSNLLSLALAILFTSIAVSANFEDLRFTDFDVASQLWANEIMDNSSLDLRSPSGCSYCAEIFYHEPPPDDILHMPAPPMHPNLHASLMDVMSAEKHPEVGDQCSYCNVFYNNGEQLHNSGLQADFSSRIIVILASFLMISLVLFFYVVGARRTKIIASLTQAKIFKSNQQANNQNSTDKNGSLHASLVNSGVRIADPCYLQTNRDKNLTSPIISDHTPHKKTSIPSKYWAQPGSIIGRTIRRIPNEYEVPSSQTNSTGTSSAVYADMNNEGSRFFSPYNLHTYAEVREVLDPNEHFHTSSNSSAMLSESNYDNNIYTHNNCPNGAMMSSGPNGSVQMSDFNSMRPIQSAPYGQASALNHHLNATKIHNGQQIYEQPPPRAQVIITSNNQGVNPTLLNYRDKIHNVI